MFSNLQNKIDLKRIKEDNIEIDTEFAFSENFDVVNQTLSYFKNEKHKTNNIVIREEVIEYEDEEVFESLEQNVQDEQNFIYNDEGTLATVDQVLSDEDEEVMSEGFQESYTKYHKVRGILPQLLEDANNDMKMELDQYRMVADEASLKEGEYDVEALFDKEILDLAKSEHLDQLHTVNWLEKQLVAYRQAMKDSLANGKEFEIDNGLRKLDVNDTEEIKNKIKDLNESISFLKTNLVN